jgi:ABC-2 type transport system permease protein
MLLTLIQKELRSLLATPANWLLLAGLQFIFAWDFLGRLDAYMQVQTQLAHYANAPGVTQSVAAPLCGTLALILMMLTPLFTMRQIAEERRNQTFVLLLAAPISSSQIVWAKFIALMIFLSLLIAANLAMACSLALGTQLDIGLLLVNGLGLLLLTACYAALGLYLSSLTQQPIIAAVSTLAVLFALWLLDFSATDAQLYLRALSPTAHFRSLNSGVLNSVDVAYFLLFSLVCLLLAARRVENNRVYG